MDYFTNDLSMPAQDNPDPPHVMYAYIFIGIHLCCIHG